MTYRRANHDNFHVRVFKEEGTPTTLFDMAVLNELDRYHLAIEAIDRVGATGGKAAMAMQGFEDKLAEHRQYVREHDEDMPEIRDWTWERIWEAPSLAPHSPKMRRRLSTAQCA